jgi:ParB-like chromosome segregation protein Spo0J
VTQFQLFDLLEPDEYDSLKADIAKRGVLVPIEFDEAGNILDGHHRHRICGELGIRDYPRVVRSFASEDEKEEHVVTLNVRRRHLNSEQKRKWAEWFVKRHPERSDRQIASDVGLSHPTIAKVREDLQESGDVERITTRIDSTGRRQPATKPKPPPSVFANSDNQQRRGQEALVSLGGQAPSKMLDVKRAERIAREKAAEERRAQPVESVTTVGDVDIRHGDFREVLDSIEPRSVDAIITDPPYPQEYWPLYGDLGVLAARVLKPNGVLAVMIGTRLEMLDNVDGQIGRHMRRRHRGIYLTPGQRWRDQVEHVATGYKPILIYAHPDADDVRWINDDVFTSSGTREADQRFHHWGQSEAGFADLIRGLTEPGQLVVDPFLGGGTTAVVCRDLGRRFIGCDIDAAHVATSRERVA